MKRFSGLLGNIKEFLNEEISSLSELEVRPYTRRSSLDENDPTSNGHSRSGRSRSTSLGEKDIVLRDIKDNKHESGHSSSPKENHKEHHHKSSHHKKDKPKEEKEKDKDKEKEKEKDKDKDKKEKDKTDKNTEKEKNGHSHSSHHSNSNSSSWLYKQVSVNTTGLAGHSMGGLASLILSSTDKRFTAVAPIASVYAFEDVVDKITVPLMFISGSVDFLCDQSDIWEMYQVALTPKIQPEVVGGWHCGFMDESVVVPDFLCRPPIDWIYREQILELTRCLLTPFFNLYLKGNTSTSNYVWGSKIFDYKLVELNEDAGFSLLPSNQTVHFGSQQQAKFVAKLHNSFKNTNSFKLSVTNKSCPTVINPNFVTLKPGESQPIAIIMTIQSNGINFATIEAISQHDHETKQSCQVFAET